jgi:glutamyl-tRNA reductase
VLQWLADYHHLSLDELRASAYVHEEHAQCVT